MGLVLYKPKHKTKSKHNQLWPIFFDPVHPHLFNNKTSQGFDPFDSLSTSPPRSATPKHHHHLHSATTHSTLHHHIFPPPPLHHIPNASVQNISLASKIQENVKIQLGAKIFKRLRLLYLILGLVLQLGKRQMKMEKP